MPVELSAASFLAPSGHGLLAPSDVAAFVAAAVVAVFVGAAVQSTVGLGLGLVAAPVLSFLDPTLVPGALLVAVIALPGLTLLQEWRHVDWRGLAWGLPARLPGTALGVWVVAALEPRALAGAVGAMVLVAVALSLWSLRVRITPVSLVAAGTLSGLTGTATTIGGPPMALLYQYEEPARVRATLAAFFLLGGAVSLAALALGGQMDARTAAVGACAVPFVVAGFFAGTALRRRVDAGRLRAALLAVVAASALGLLARAFLG
ncbi:sulfite exporter TauE/SafE family protein [Nocardiopsis sp. HUAS JQ3]|uniref:sulfite exporter TauE/SafE family protein n=1 Tax=Nocardiopsis sp. HUAS JQ3 TaxID=3061629 RepID=UPI0023A99C68|nr:sulfite exporter TauE/SafE family protein [Nocardiopsis sp. HUAS JQ3]WDZ89031.1 sulfite exporter TauE/SafE family protein [Nocardiopsis sp. HUAS JQ3]